LSEDKKKKTACPSTFPSTPLRERLGDQADPAPKEEIGVPEELKFKRHYTMSEAAFAQRRKAGKSAIGNKNNWKHGKYAKDFISARIKPCKSTCPQYPCEIVADGGTKAGAACLDKASVIKAYQDITEALKNKNFDGFNDLISLTLAEAIHTVNMLLQDVIHDGTILKRKKYDKEGAFVGYEVVTHPSLLALPKMIADLGITPAEFLITPRSLAKADVDEESSKTLADVMGRISSSLIKKKEKKESKDASDGDD